MMFNPNSLRLRLFYLILLPLIAVAMVLGAWYFLQTRDKAHDAFDRTLLSAAVAIARDVAFSEGDAMQSSTHELIGDNAGGKIFYHVTGPNGDYITGYGYPPPLTTASKTDDNSIYFYDTTYRGEPVRMIAIQGHNGNSAIRGLASIKVWQYLTDREQFVREPTIRAVAILLIMLLALALTVWVGVKTGLSPLHDLQHAIEQRSADDLSLIKRRVPVEVKGIVSTLNRLFKQVTGYIEAHQNFISDAAHQLRNPMAATLAMAESLSDAKTEEEKLDRLQALLKSARKSARITTQLLALERVSNPDLIAQTEIFDLNQLVKEEAAEFGYKVLKVGLNFEFNMSAQALMVNADMVLIAEAIKNLLDNALVHGGKEMTFVRVSTEATTTTHCVNVCNDGKSLTAEDEKMIFARFRQLESGEGSGLGLPIVEKIMQRSNGQVKLNHVAKGVSISLHFPKY